MDLLSGSSSFGRASAFQAEGGRFEPGLPLKFNPGSSHIVPRIGNRKIKGRGGCDPRSFEIWSVSRVGYNAALSRRRSGVRIPYGPQRVRDTRRDWSHSVKKVMVVKKSSTLMRYRFGLTIARSCIADVRIDRFYVVRH